MVTIQTETDPVELLEELFDQLSVPQRRFLTARIETPSDVQAAQISGISVESVRLWRQDNVSFVLVYDAAVKAGRTGATKMNLLRLQQLSARCGEVITGFLNYDPTDEEISAGAAEFKHKKARLALDIVKTISGFQPREAPKRPTPKLDKQADVLELTKGSMNNAGKPRP